MDQAAELRELVNRHNNSTLDKLNIISVISG